MAAVLITVAIAIACATDADPCRTCVEARLNRSMAELEEQRALRPADPTVPIVREVVQQFYVALANQDLDAARSLMTPGAFAVVGGVGETGASTGALADAITRWWGDEATTTAVRVVSIGGGGPHQEGGVFVYDARFAARVCTPTPGTPWSGSDRIVLVHEGVTWRIASIAHAPAARMPVLNDSGRAMYPVPVCPGRGP